MSLGLTRVASAVVALLDEGSIHVERSGDHASCAPFVRDKIHECCRIQLDFLFCLSTLGIEIENYYYAHRAKVNFEISLELPSVARRMISL